jgi:hypothetical protein
MPVGLPPLGGPAGRSRRRLSASSLVTWERCPKEWFYTSKLGLRGPVVPEMVLGLVVEDALIGLFMESPLENPIKASSNTKPRTISGTTGPLSPSLLV